jgi:hypothetical protein
MKKYKTALQLFLTGALTITVISGCNKDYFDINQNPNSPADASVNELLPSAQGAVAHALGNNIQLFGGIWGQYWTQSPASSQYKVYEQYSPGANEFDRPWKALYADALQDLRTIVTKATAEQKPNYVACAKILQAYTFQLLTDNWGDIPFHEAIQGAEGILSPRYDTQHDVYHGIMDLATDGLALIDENSDVHPGQDDLFFGGDMLLWREFGNTLLLRIYLRIAYIDPGEASSGIGQLQASAAEFLYPGEDVKIDYFEIGGNSNPLYSSIVDVGFTQNLVASATAINYMNSNNDPRLDVLYVPSSLGQIGIAQGAYDLSASTPVSIPSAATGGDGGDESSALAPVKLMTAYESLFLQAEAMARGWLTGDAETTYRDAITESFAAYGITGDTVNYYLDSVPAAAFPAAGTVEQKVEAIITQKWIAMCAQEGSEGWIEQRRTGYPTFFTPSTNSIIGTGRFPERFYYPTSEVTRNANYPGQKLIYEKMWWDIN